MQQLQKVICQAEADKEELNEKFNASLSILKFMETSMYGKMHELSQLSVKKWENKYVLNKYNNKKKQLNNQMIDKQNKLNKYDKIVKNVEKETNEYQIDLQKRLKIQRTLMEVGTKSVNINTQNDIKKIKVITKKLAKVLIQIKDELRKKQSQVKKYQERVNLLQHQFDNLNKNTSNNNLP